MENGFVETKVDRKVEHIHSLWHVWSSYESRNTSDGPVIERGINSLSCILTVNDFGSLGRFYA